MNDSMRRAIALAGGLLGTVALAAPQRGQGYLVDGRCVTVTAVQGDTVSYAWQERIANGSRSGSGTLSADDLGARCNVGAARPPAAATAPPAQPAAPVATRPPVSRPAPVGSTPAGFAQEMLQVHNRLRCRHGAPPLQWSNEVAAYAQRWVERAGYKHSDSYRSPLGPMGENLGSGHATGADAVQAWYDESEAYDYGRVRQRGVTGHFTAMIWKDARLLGCTRVGAVTMCNYAAGNPPADCAVPNFNTDRCTLQQVRPASRGEQSC